MGFCFVLHLRSMGLSVLGYQSHLLQRCRPACGHQGSFFPSLPVSRLTFLVAIQVQHSYNLSINGSNFLLPRVFMLSATTDARIKIRLRQEESNSRLPHHLSGSAGYLLLIDHSGDEGAASIPEYELQTKEVCLRCSSFYEVIALSKSHRLYWYNGM